jgi:hypothetical protein
MTKLEESKMNFKIGTQPRITEAPAAEAEAKTSVPTAVPENTLQDAPPLEAANTSIRADSQLSAAVFTGDGDDRVDIKMGSDGRVHVNVNGKEAWSGSTKQFAALTINTGGGKDTVTNSVAGAKINTGDQDDTGSSLIPVTESIQ